MKTLVIFYSYTGNTLQIAQQIQRELECDIEKIELVTPYEGSYDDVVELGQKQVNEGYMPEIKELSKDIHNYEMIIVGTPTWWYTMAPAVKTFLSSQNWEDKTMVLFQTHAGWPGSTLKDMQKLCKGAKIKSSKQIKFDSDGGNTLVTPMAEIQEWISSLK